MYPHERPDLAPRTRGVIALMDENCTVCMLCSRECPDWCIYIDSHKETVPAAKEGGRARTRNVLDRFAIDFSLCMYCGICVEVCPFDALWWSPEFEYSEYSIDRLLHEMGRCASGPTPSPPRRCSTTAPTRPPRSPTRSRRPTRRCGRPRPAAGAAAAAAAGAAAGAAAAGGRGKAAPKKAEIHVEGGQIDQETYDAADRRGQERAHRPLEGQGRVGPQGEGAPGRRGACGRAAEVAEVAGGGRLGRRGRCGGPRPRPAPRRLPPTGRRS
jgi:NADH-quinone oxidoreductase subunit I